MEQDTQATEYSTEARLHVIWGRCSEQHTMNLQMQRYGQAALCYEELLLHMPASAALHTQLADVLYTMGGASNMATARSYYAAAVQLSRGALIARAAGPVRLCRT